MQKATWLVKSVRALRKKTDGPGLQFLQYGKNREGYWDAEMFGKQIDRILDCFDCLHPDWQLCLEVDWSMNHAAHRTDALSALKMNLGYGGKQSTPHESLMDPAHASLLLGPEPAFMSIGGAEVDCKLKPGDTQHFYFKPDDPPPWYKPGAPKYDRIGSEGKVHVLASCWDFANETTALMEKLGEVSHPLPPQQRLRREEPRRERAELVALGQPTTAHDPQVRSQDAGLPAGVRR